jgi:hypothetical protein
LAAGEIEKVLRGVAFVALEEAVGRRQLVAEREGDRFAKDVFVERDIVGHFGASEWWV